ncbi:MAG: arginase family protein [Bacteroidales bacterium]|nr:arginase family protein [Bacteroidales bacterium]
MELLDYIDPVELDKPDDLIVESEELLNKHIDIHTPNTELGDISQYQLVLIGIPEDRNSFNKGASLAPDRIRGELYKLIFPDCKMKILDIGNIKKGNTFKDTYFAVKEVVYHLLCKNVVVLAMGGTQELTVPVYQAFELYQDNINLATIDYKIDFVNDALDFTPDSYLSELLLKKHKLFKYINLAHQIYLTEKQNLQIINSLYQQAIRLGDLRLILPTSESILRDIDIVSFDIRAVCMADAPGAINSSPNGLRAEEACVLTRFAGFSDQLRLFLLSEINPENDNNHQTCKLAAQMLWYFIEGLSRRYPETPLDENHNFKTFIIGLSDLDQEIVFYRSLTSDRWWLRIPSSRFNKDCIVPCNYEDYVAASKQEVPDIWWKYFQKLN